MKTRIVLLLLITFVLGIGAKAQTPALHPPALGPRIVFNGYQEIDGLYLFQIYFLEPAGAQQPGFLKKGDPVLSTGYTIGTFHRKIVTRENPDTHQKESVDGSTLDLISPDKKTHLTLTYRVATVLFE